MTYQEYLEKFNTAKFDERLPADTKPWNEDEFRFMMKSPETKAFPDDPIVKIQLREIYLRLRRFLEKSNAKNKNEQLIQLDRMYLDVEEKLNL